MQGVCLHFVILLSLSIASSSGIFSVLHTEMCKGLIAKICYEWRALHRNSKRKYWIVQYTSETDYKVSNNVGSCNIAPYKFLFPRIIEQNKVVNLQ